MSSDEITLEDVQETKSLMQFVGLVLGLAVFIGMLISSPPEGLSPEGWKVLSMAILMAIWWMTEAVPISVTALIPLVAIPLMDIGSVKEAAKGFTSKAIWLTLGGFVLGIALQRWNLHTRIAMNTVRLVGTEPRRVIGGFMLATAFLSMWMTNTATTVMMMPIAISVAMLLVKEGGGDEYMRKNFGTALMIGLAYSATVGGMMTLVGTSTNVMFKGFMEDRFGITIEFMDWMKIGVPVGMVMLVSIWLFLTYIMFPCNLEKNDKIKDIIDQKLGSLGKMSAGERRTLFIFVFTAALWMGKGLLEQFIPWLHLNDASIGVLGAMLLFVVPSSIKKREFLLRWEDTRDVPWGILLLLGGGLSLAGFLNSTGVADWMGNYITQFDGFSVVTLVLLTTLLIIFLSELMSNVATLTAFLPVIIVVALGFGENPLTFAIPAALVASCAFMLPIGTPPNAIVFGSGLITIPQMARTGFLINIYGLIVINLISYILLPVVFGVEHGVMPDWAK